MLQRGGGYLMGFGFFALASLGCASGAVTGSVTESGRAAAPLVMKWNSGLFGESGKISATMPDGEQFAGTYQVVKPGISRSKLEPAWTGDEPGKYQGKIDDTMWGAGRDTMSFLRAYENKAIATLKGDRGTRMLCRFNLDSGGVGMGGGGTGECQTSKGAKIIATF